MAVNAAVVTRTDLNSTGNKTVSLPANFDPIAVIARFVFNTADGSVAHRHVCMGFGTYRSAAVQQWYWTAKSVDAAANAADACGSNSTSLIRAFTETTDSVTIACEVDLVSMQTGATSEVVYNVVTAAAAASRMDLLILGGADITDAYVSNHSTGGGGVREANFTSIAGFGQSDLIFTGGVAFATGDALRDIYHNFGWARKGQQGMCVSHGMDDGNAACVMCMSQRADRIIRYMPNGATTIEVDAALSTTLASWPTDGIRINFLADSFTETFGVLHLKGTFQALDGVDTAPTAGGLPVDQDDDVGFTPRAAITKHWNLAAATGVDTSSADLGAAGVGFFDGTTEAWGGWTEDDAALAMDSNTQHSTAKIIRHYNQAAALQSECDGVFTGTTFRRSWNDIDTVAREHQWLVIGDAPAAGATSLIYQPALRPVYLR